MPARVTRQDARQRMIDLFMSSLDRVIPADEAVPPRGRTFLDREKQAEQMKRAVVPALLEERAALEEGALVVTGGRCPSCGSDRVYLEKPTSKAEARSPDGPVCHEEQHCRCRACGGSFSPQRRDWGLPSEAPLTPRAAERVARESAVQPFDGAARAMQGPSVLP